MKIKIWVFVFALFATPNSFAATIPADSCSQADVSTAITASLDGDTVTIPAGTCTWGDSGTYVLVDKAITLQGAGQDVTIINLSSSGSTWASGVIRITDGATVKSFTINAPEATTHVSALSVGTVSGFRITDIKYVGYSGCDGYFAYVGDVYGLIDNCTITGANESQELIFSRGPTDSWQTDHSIGGANNLFVENCTFAGSGYVCDINSNGRAVFRYNTITGYMKIDGHGKCTNSPARSVRHMEIYNNLWTKTDGYWMAIEIRGGTGRIFNNVCDVATTGGWFDLKDYATFQSGCAGYTPNCGCPDDYPLDDQIGVGKDPKSAASEPYYVWNNHKNGDAWVPGTVSVGEVCNTADQCGVDYTEVTQIQNNRDYYTSATKPVAMSGYTEYTCPHPLAGSGTCDSNTAGITGYALAAAAHQPNSGKRVGWSGSGGTHK